MIALQCIHIKKKNCYDFLSRTTVKGKILYGKAIAFQCKKRKIFLTGGIHFLRLKHFLSTSSKQLYCRIILENHNRSVRGSSMGSEIIRILALYLIGVFFLCYLFVEIKTNFYSCLRFLLASAVTSPCPRVSPFISFVLAELIGIVVAYI